MGLHQNNRRSYIIWLFYGLYNNIQPLMSCHPNNAMTHHQLKNEECSSGTNIQTIDLFQPYGRYDRGTTVSVLRGWRCLVFVIFNFNGTPLVYRLVACEFLPFFSNFFI